MSQGPPPADPAALSPLKRAFLALEAAQARIAALEAGATGPIAIIGIGCRVPGADDPDGFWALLRDGRDLVGPVPPGRWDGEALFDPNPDTPGRIATRQAGYLRTPIDEFDPAFFGIAPREAQGMDPQQRLLLEVAWEALEHAGQAPDRLERSPTGVYVGATGNDYASLQLGTGDVGLLDSHYASGIAHSVLSGRISYLLGLQGPSLTVDTACSSSLVAVHLACQALRAGDCRMALAGGVNLILSPDVYIALSRSRMLAADGRCKTFDAAADGFGRGEGCGVVVFKRLADALADGDRVLAVIRGSGVNQDGPSSGLTAPNGPAQEAVIRQALARAGITPGEVSYLEAHGTGTELGDPLEVQAVTRVFGPGRDPTQPLSIGSVKTNFGHLEAAAGVTGLIKLVLALQARAIPAHLHFHRPSPHIPWDDMPLRVPTALTPWPAIGGRRIAGVSSFGFSGTNAHVVVEEAPALAPPVSAAPADRRQLFVLSARTRQSLAVLAGRYAAALAGRPDEDLADVCFTAAVGRAQHPERAAVLARSMSELREHLTALAAGRPVEGVTTTRLGRRDPARIAFLFAGQGAQHAGMARALFEGEPVFRAALERCARVLDGRLPRPLLEVIFAATPEAALDQTQYTQPALFAIEWALAELWRAWGITADVLIGHSVGEYTAACLAGVLSLEDALSLIAERGRLMQSLPPGGAMAAVFAAEAAVHEELSRQGGTLSIAAVNGPAQTVVSGAAAAIETICATFAGRGVRCQRLPVSHAFHSSLVDPILDDFERAAGAVKLNSPRLRLVSNLTGAVADAQEITRPRYWRRHLREAVRFGDGLRALAAAAPDLCLELGPHPTLLSFAREAFGDRAPTLVPTLRKGLFDHDQLAEALAALFLAGAPVDWRAVWSSSGARLTDLPPHPFERERCWFQARPGSTRGSREPGHPLLGGRVRAALRDGVVFEGLLRADQLPFLAHHRVQGRSILPATGFVELALAAGRALANGSRAVRDLVIAESLAIGDDETRVVQVVVRTGASTIFEILSQPAGDGEPTWTLHAQGNLAELSAPDPAEAPAAVRARCPEVIEGPAHYAALAARGLAFGPSLHGVRRIHRRDGEALGEIAAVDPAVAGAGDYVFHPALLDACLQVLAAALPGTTAQAYLPLAIDEVRVHRAVGASLVSHAVVESPAGAGTVKARVTVLDEQGVVAELRGLALRPAGAAAVSPLYRIDWQPEAGGSWPAPGELAAGMAPAVEALARTHELDRYHQGWLAVEALSTEWIAEALLQLGWSPRPGDTVTADELATRLGVVPRYRGLLTRLLEILTEDGVLRAGGAGWTVVRPPATSEASRRLPQQLLLHPTSHARLTLAGNCGAALPAILSGRADALESLFPGGSTALAESLYREAPEAKVFNQLAAVTVRLAVAGRAASQRLRVLEVGGGTGGTTAWVAPALPAERTEYLFTDVGPLMVARARERFASHRFMEFGTLDLELEPAAQGLSERQFDLIIAANVVHATSDLRRTLTRLHGLLAPGGLLLMLEVAGPERWIDITFGLTEGWWRFTDHDLRPTYPLLTRARWLALLTQLGFEAAAGGEHPQSREVLLVARKPQAAPLAATSGRWLIVADEGGVGDALAGHLRALGQAATCVRGEALTAALAGEEAGLAGIVHLAGLDLSPPSEDGTAALIDGQRASLGSLLALVQALGARSYAAGATPRLVIVSRGAVAVDGVSGALNLAQAPLWGMGNVVGLEHPELRPLRIDLDPDTTAHAQVPALAARLRGGEPAVALRGGDALVPRLARLPDRRTGADPVRLEKGDGGTFDGLALRPAARRAPGPGEVEVRVLAAGLNFRDVMNALAMRADPEPLGGECAGTIVTVGEGVTDLAPGDAVVATAEASFATFAVTEARNVARLPPGMSFADAATLPLAFMTAHHALHTLGELRAGQSVLIHAGAGGVGLAAIQLAQQAGAIIFATAGSEEKRAFLRSLGVPHVLGSRTLDFAGEILTLTGGRGVDLVLNSLAGDFIEASVRALARDGRFLEIGKQDIWTPEQFRRVRPDGRYHAIDLSAMRKADTWSALFGQVMAGAARGELRPLPRHVFPLDRAGDAFRFMAQARHTGKVVLTSDGAGVTLDRLAPDASYLITGGLAGLGLLTATRLVRGGARHLVLVGRRAPAPPAEAAIAAMRAAGARITVAQADVAQPGEVARVLALADTGGSPLRGIVHAAGALEDGALVQQRWERFARPLGAKVDGSWALHRLTRQRPLDFFVMYSSIASVLGSSGQANHAGANAFMDALSGYRRAQGLPALSISWGAWSEVGAAAERGMETRLAGQGIELITPEAGLALLEDLMAGAPPHVAVFPVDWPRFLATGDRTGPFLERMRRVDPTPRRSAPAAAPQETVSLADQLQQAGTAARRSELLLTFVGEHVARVVGVSSARAIDPHQPLNELGLDSLMAVELRNRLGTGLGLARSLPATLVFDHPTLEALATYLGEVIRPAAPAVVPVVAARADAVGAIDDLSDEQIEELFARKTRKI